LPAQGTGRSAPTGDFLISNPTEARDPRPSLLLMLSRTKGLALNVHRICLEPCGWNLHRTASSLTPRLQRQSLSSSAFAMSLIRHPPDGRTAPPFQPHEPRGSCEHFHTSSICFASPPDDVAASQALSDPSRPDLFYHLVGPPSPLSSSRPVFAVSFLSAPPTTPESSTILGWLPATTDAHAQQHVGLSDFKENREFATSKPMRLSGS
jgi:hypothetical protein